MRIYRLRSLLIARQMPDFRAVPTRPPGVAAIHLIGYQKPEEAAHTAGV
jgi:hypothetical protein